jgi:hypothetical protein
VHNEFMTLKFSPLSPNQSRLGLKAAFYFSALRLFIHQETFAHATATRTDPTRQPLNPYRF